MREGVCDQQCGLLGNNRTKCRLAAAAAATKAGTGTAGTHGGALASRLGIGQKVLEMELFLIRGLGSLLDNGMALTACFSLSGQFWVLDWVGLVGRKG
jgi:hypothetical protein